MLTFVLLLLAVVVIAALAYWEIGMAEGVHLGQRVVTWLYDLIARRYNGIKQFEPFYEKWFIGEPLALALENIPAPLVLDVATGTGRLPITLLAQPEFHGQVIGVDASRRMLAQAAQSTHPHAPCLLLVWQNALALPFDDGSFDAVTCLEALEFMPDTRRALQEMLRVLRPGGLLLVTNRIGPWRKFLLGHSQTPPAFEALLQSLGLECVHTQTWQVEYDLVWATKPGAQMRTRCTSLVGLLRCPRCKNRLAQIAPERPALVCSTCSRQYPTAPDGVIELAQPTTGENPA